MAFVLQPWQLCLIILASWINREQQNVIEHLMTENRVLKEKLGNGRILLNDEQRRRLAVKGKILGRRLLREFGTLFTPDTILRWHRQLVANKWDYNDRRKIRVGRPRVRKVIVDLVLKFAQENSTWGYDRIQGARRCTFRMPFTFGRKAPDARNNLLATPVYYKGRVYLASGQQPNHGEGPGGLCCIDPTKTGDVSSELAVDAGGKSLPKPQDLHMERTASASKEANIEVRGFV